MTRITSPFLLALLLALSAASAHAEESTSAPEEAVDPSLLAPPPTYPNLKIGGFADVNFFASDSPARNSNSGFSEGQFVLHFTSALADRISFFGEFSLTARNAGTFAPTVERTIIRYDHNNLVQISLGRYHTPINYWNTAFHHGQWLQTTVARPDVTRFGGNFIPVHFVGALLEGSHPAGGLNFNYKAGIGNGRENAISQPGDAGDFNNNRAWLASVFLRPDRFYPLQIGGAYYRDKIRQTTFREQSEAISTVHIAYTSERPEVIAEFTNVYYRDYATQRTFNSQAWYAQVAYRLPWWNERAKPYFRYEDLATDRTDPVFATTQFARKGTITGLRWDFSELVALKGEWRHQRDNTLGYVDSLFSQVSFAF